MSELISGKEAKLAWANGENVEASCDGSKFSLLDETMPLCVFNDNHYKFRIKPRTIMIGDVEVHAPFEPKDGDRYYHIYPEYECGYGFNDFDSIELDSPYMQFGAYRTESEIKQVVAALRKLFKGE